jgi:hypothetical protein
MKPLKELGLELGPRHLQQGISHYTGWKKLLSEVVSCHGRFVAGGWRGHVWNWSGIRTRGVLDANEPSLGEGH